MVPGKLLVPVNVDDPPRQIAKGDAEAEITGLGFTVTVIVAVPVHPEALPNTVYVVVEAGETVTDEPVKFPGFHVNTAPDTLLLADNVVELPEQMVEGVAVGVILRLGLTVTVTLAEPVHPKELPYTVYMVVTVGVTVIVEPGDPPGSQA